MSSQDTIERVRSFAQISLACYALTAALSIALSQIFCIAFILTSLIETRLRKTQISSLFYTRFQRKFSTSLGVWVLLALIAAFAGVHLADASKELAKTLVYLLFPFAIYLHFHSLDSLGKSFNKVVTVLYFLIAGQALAGVHSVLSSCLKYEISPKIPGPVTESGQLVLVLPLAALLFLYSHSIHKEDSEGVETIPRAKYWAAFCVSLLLSLAAGWSSRFTESASVINGLCILNTTLLFTVLATFLKQLITKQRISEKLISLSLGLLVAVLLLNLKRGPWLGTAIALSLLGFHISKRILLSLFALGVACLLFIPPIQERISSSISHFTLAGGRQEMWEIGIELASRFPLGVGLDNAQMMRKLEPSLPLLHRHMHNNFLNIAVETGWLGLSAFIWWLGVCVIGGYQMWRSSRGKSSELKKAGTLALAISAALLGSQVAGLVEYNFGDGEVRMMSFLFMGLLLVLSQHLEEARAS